MALLAAMLGGCGGSGPGPAGATWRFVIFGDTRGNFDPAANPPFDPKTATGVSPMLPKLAAKIAAVDPEFVLHVGDLVGGDMYLDAVQLGMLPAADTIPYDRQFQAFKDAVQPITAKQIPIYPVRGNHEVSNMDGLSGPPDPALFAAYQRAFAQYLPQNCPTAKGLTYSFGHKEVTVVAMDQYSNYVPPLPTPIPWMAPKNADWGTNLWGFHTVNQTWVSEQLRQATTPFKIVLAHEPIFVAQGKRDPAMTYRWSPELFFGPADLGGTAARQQFVDMLGSNGVQLYAVGHVHNQSIGSFNDSAGHLLYQLVAGNGGASPMDTTPNPPKPEPALHGLKYELSKLGFTLVTVNPLANTMTLEYYITDSTGTNWSKEPYTTTIAGNVSR